MPAAHELIAPAPVGDAGAAKRFQLTIWVQDTDAVCKQLAARGVELLNGPMNREWGLRTAAFTDPDGHIWEVAAKIPTWAERRSSDVPERRLTRRSCLLHGSAQHSVQAPRFRDPFQLMLAGVLEHQTGSGCQILDGRRNEELARRRRRRNAGADVDGQPIRLAVVAGPDGGKALVGFQPFQFEGFLREVGEPAPERVLPPPLETPPDIARLVEIGARNGLEILGPPGPPNR